jgi:CheY-like chemotaxis protein
MQKTSFLVVDDDPIALEVARGRLEEMGFEVATRGQALGTSTWILQHRPDFVLLDVMMPALTGGELAHVLRRRAASTAVILHSSKDPAELRALVEKTGALGAIQKGLDAGAFARQLHKLLRPVLGERADVRGGGR